MECVRGQAEAAASITWHRFAFVVQVSRGWFESWASEDVLVPLLSWAGPGENFQEASEMQLPACNISVSAGTPSPASVLLLLLQGFACWFLNICIFQCFLSVGNQGCLVKAETCSKCKSGKKLPFLCALQLSQQNDSFLPSVVSNLFFNSKTKTLLQERRVNAVLVFPMKLSWLRD